ncbi:MAG: hypothetical protein IT319_10980 [Anaerolineae bacterium]|nr:hypothetical protein [Anaerolineae bacterium]
MAQSGRNTLGAILLIGLGVLFLIGQTFGINLWSVFNVSWPIFILIPGVIFLALAFLGDRRMSGFVFPGTIVTGTGLILWFQNATDNWQSWAYIWTLYPVFLGLALMFNGQRTGKEKEVRTGRGFVTFGVVAFLVGAAFFELLIFGGNSALVRWVLPLGLIGAGGYLLLTGRIPALVIGDKRKNDQPVFTGARNVGTTARSNGRLSPSDELQRQIDEALAEDEPSDPKPRA